MDAPRSNEPLHYRGFKKDDFKLILSDIKSISGDILCTIKSVVQYLFEHYKLKLERHFWKFVNRRKYNILRRFPSLDITAGCLY